MAYVRLSLVQPRRGETERVEALMREIAAVAEGADGCIASYVLKPDDEGQEIGRIAIYEDGAAADKVAVSDHILSLRSELHLLVEPGHVERAFVTV